MRPQFLIPKRCFDLFAYDWNRPFVKAFVKFLNIARTVMSNIILTTLNPSMPVKKITALDAIFIEVMRGGSPSKDGIYRRLAKGPPQHHAALKLTNC